MRYVCWNKRCSTNWKDKKGEVYHREIVVSPLSAFGMARLVCPRCKESMVEQPKAVTR